jgi:hypothetical protein
VLSEAEARGLAGSLMSRYSVTRPFVTEEGFIAQYYEAQQTMVGGVCPAMDILRIISASTFRVIDGAAVVLRTFG